MILHLIDRGSVGGCIVHSESLEISESPGRGGEVPSTLLDEPVEALLVWATTGWASRVDRLSVIKGGEKPKASVDLEKTELAAAMSAGQTKLRALHAMLWDWPYGKSCKGPVKIIGSAPNVHSFAERRKVGVQLRQVFSVSRVFTLAHGGCHKTQVERNAGSRQRKSPRHGNES